MGGVPVCYGGHDGAARDGTDLRGKWWEMSSTRDKNDSLTFANHFGMLHKGTLMRGNFTTSQNCFHNNLYMKNLTYLHKAICVCHGPTNAPHFFELENPALVWTIEKLGLLHVTHFACIKIVVVGLFPAKHIKSSVRWDYGIPDKIKLCTMTSVSDGTRYALHGMFALANAFAR